MNSCEDYQNVPHRHVMSKHCWKNGANRLSLGSGARNLIKASIKQKLNHTYHIQQYICII